MAAIPLRSIFVHSHLNLDVLVQYFPTIQLLMPDDRLGSFPALAIFLIQNQSLRLSSRKVRTFARRQAVTFGWQLYYRNRPTPDLHGRPAKDGNAATPVIVKPKDDGTHIHHLL